MICRTLIESWSTLNTMARIVFLHAIGVLHDHVAGVGLLHGATTWAVAQV